MEDKTQLYLEDLRLNPHYVIWYKNVFTVLVTLLIPFGLLAYWNCNTYIILHRRHSRYHHIRLHAPHPTPINPDSHGPPEKIMVAPLIHENANEHFLEDVQRYALIELPKACSQVAAASTLNCATFAESVQRSSQGNGGIAVNKVSTTVPPKPKGYSCIV